MSNRRRRISISRWVETFESLRPKFPEASDILDRWIFRGLPEGYIKSSLYLYAHGALGAKELRAKRLRLGPFSDLHRKTKALSQALRNFEEHEGRELYFKLLELQSPLAKVSSTLQHVKDPVPKLFWALPALLDVYAFTFDHCERALKRVPAKRDVVQSRSLVMMFLALKRTVRSSNNRLHHEMAAIVELAYEASGATRHDPVSYESVRNRIARFREVHSPEYQWLEQYIENFGMPRTAHDFLLLTGGL